MCLWSDISPTYDKLTNGRTGYTLLIKGPSAFKLNILTSINSYFCNVSNLSSCSRDLLTDWCVSLDVDWWGSRAPCPLSPKPSVDSSPLSTLDDSGICTEQSNPSDHRSKQKISTGIPYMLRFHNYSENETCSLCNQLTSSFISLLVSNSVCYEIHV